MNGLRLRILPVIFVCLVGLACSHDDAGKPASAQFIAANVDAERLADAANDPNNWMSHGRTYAEERFSPLKQINDSNVQNLGLAWYFESDSTVGTEATPLVIDGVMYTTSTWNILHAFNAATGEELWRYDPQLPRYWIRYTCCGPINRGPAVWKGRVYFGTIDGP